VESFSFDRMIPGYEMVFSRRLGERAVVPVKEKAGGLLFNFSRKRLRLSRRAKCKTRREGAVTGLCVTAGHVSRLSSGLSL
jgi:hypothetical protein